MNGLPRWTASLAALALGVAAWRCSGPSDAQRTAFIPPPRAGFEPVSDMLHARCGSLDCHGQVARNLRLYGVNGLRFSAVDFPGTEGDTTTPAEHDRNYAAAVALEPEIIDQVVREGGSDPGRLTLLRKARGTEDHVGGAVIAAGSEADRCITSWLASSVDLGACSRGAEIARPAFP
jgi:hypothetical protein